MIPAEMPPKIDSPDINKNEINETFNLPKEVRWAEEIRMRVIEKMKGDVTIGTLPEVMQGFMDEFENHYLKYPDLSGEERKMVYERAKSIYEIFAGTVVGYGLNVHDHHVKNILDHMQALTQSLK